ncbi:MULTISPECIES: hypothetical protein [unclassified Rhodococcus (in: high G+C Gram-positive bacteria)]|uniref:hypothetical protein n=1 Tax=unclassified Rhodococcus (in: high G+C Gram-positive bacteria) TaxID=192944 RepID=UPI0011424691|nr:MULTISPECIES: hypothetical protein [unclassified Rhodococcus (in: high G+C Gram-positive bacteria)]RZL20868.1 MAG: hypothetical protein EOP31_30490 [Rhodococcus sp. (in: high G+C Gram-positive bacteria)]
MRRKGARPSALDDSFESVRGQRYSRTATENVPFESHLAKRFRTAQSLHPDATARSEDKGAYRVVSVRVNASGVRSTYAIEVQAAVGFEFTDETFTVMVDAPEGFDQAVRRAVRKSVTRAGEWNSDNPDATWVLVNVATPMDSVTLVAP